MCEKLVKLMNEASKYAEETCKKIPCKECIAYEESKNGKENCIDILAADYLIRNGVVLREQKELKGHNDAR